MLDRVKWTEAPAPVTEVPARYPRLRQPVYAARLERLRERMKARGLDAVVIFADREHAANFSILRGLWPPV